MKRMIKVLSIILVVTIASTGVLSATAQARSIESQQPPASAVPDETSAALMDSVVSALMGESLASITAQETPPQPPPAASASPDPADTSTAFPPADSIKIQATSLDSAPLPLYDAGPGYTGNPTIKVDLQALLDANQDPVDSDGDGLPDSVERVLGTETDNTDTDFDQLSDLYEAQNGLAPLNPDSNGDWLNDYVEIVKSNGSLDPAKDTDGDGVPDVWDSDNDGDSVPDSLDMSPFTCTATGDTFKFSATSSNKDTYFDFQVRPQDTSYLKLNGQTWNWPADDKGLMQNLDNSKENVKLTAMLELTRTQTGSGYKEMPSQDKVKDYGIIIKDKNTALVPLNTIYDGGRAVAFNGRMFFPATTVSAKKMEFNARLVWLVQGETAGIANLNISDVIGVNAFSVSSQSYHGTGTDIADISGDGNPDILMAALDDEQDRLEFGIGLNVDENGNAATWTNGQWDLPADSIGPFALGVRLYDVDGDGSLDVIVMGTSKVVEQTTGNFPNQETTYSSHMWYRIGWNMTSTGYVESWSQFNAPDETSDDQDDVENHGGGIALGDIDRDGNPELVLMRVKESGSSYNYQYVYRIGWDMDATGAVGSWSDISSQAVQTAWSPSDAITGADVLLGDFNSNSDIDLVFMTITSRNNRNYDWVFSYRAGWDLADNGNPGNGWTNTLTVGPGVGQANIYSLGLALWDIDGNGVKDMVSEWLQYVDSQWRFKYQVAKDAAGKSDTVLQRYQTPSSLTGFKAEEYAYSNAAIFYSSDKDQTGKAYVDLRYDFMQSDNALLDADTYLQQQDIQVNNQMGSYTHSDAGLMAINRDFLPEALDSLPDNEKLPIVIATENKYADKNMDDFGCINTTPASFSIVTDTAGSDVCTIKSIRLAWFDTSDDIMIQPDHFDTIAQSYNYNEEDTNETLRLLLVWDMGESRMTRIGTRQLIMESKQTEFGQAMSAFNMGAGSLRALCFMGVYGRGMGLIKAGVNIGAGFKDTLKAAMLYVKIVRGVEVAPGGISKVESILGRALRPTEFGREVPTVGFMKALRIGGLLIGAAMAIYSGWQLAAAGDFSNYSVALGVTYVAMQLAYMCLLELISLLPGGVIITALALLSDVICQFVTGESWSQRAISWLVDQLVGKPEPTVDLTIDQTDNQFTVNDVDDNGMDPGDTITLKNWFETTVEQNSNYSPGDSWYGHIKPSVFFNNSPYYDQTSSVKTTRGNPSDPTSYDRNYETTAQLTWKTAGINVPVVINFHTEHEVPLDDGSTYTGSGNRTTTLYYDVMPGTLDDFVNWGGLTANDQDGDGLVTTSDGREKAPNGQTYYTDPNNWDTDGDGLSDSFEIDYGTHPQQYHTDGDGISDGVEYKLGTDPTETDTDGDGDAHVFHDNDETFVNNQVTKYFSTTIRFFGQDITVQFRPDANLVDTDGDGLNDLREVYPNYPNQPYPFDATNRTNARSVDTDGDNAADAVDSEPKVYSAALAGNRMATAFQKGNARYVDTTPWMNNASSWTFATWIRPDDPMQDGIIYSEGTPDKLGSIAMGTNGSITVRTGKLQENGQTVTRSYTTPENILQASQWQVLLVRFNVTDTVDNVGQVIVEVDGNRYESQPVLFMEQNANLTTGVLGMDSTHIGLSSHPANEFQGSLDEVYVWYGVASDTDYRYLLSHTGSFSQAGHWSFDQVDPDHFHNVQLIESDAPVFAATHPGKEVVFKLWPLFYGQAGNKQLVITEQPQHGGVWCSNYFQINPPRSEFHYTPAQGYVGMDSFKYKVTGDAHEYSPEVTVNVHVYSLPVTGFELQDGGTGQQGTAISVNLEEGLAIYAVVKPLGASNTNVTWTVADPDLLDISPYHSEDANRASLHSKNKDGETVVTATTEDGGFVATVDVTVRPPRVVQFGQYDVSITAGESRAITQVSELTPGSSENPNVYTRPENNPLDWDTSDTDLLTVDEYGTITAHRVGTTYVYANAKDMPNYGAYDICKVIILPYTTGLELSKNATTLTVGQSDTITATVSPADAPDTSVVYESDDPDVASVGTVTKLNNVSSIPIIGHKAGHAEITVTTMDYAYSQTIDVVVTTTSSITLNKSSLTLIAGRSDQLTATVFPPFPPKTITWLSSNPSIATVDSNGRVTAIACDEDSNTGTAYISAVASDGAVCLTPCTVTVLSLVAVDGVTLDQAQLTMDFGDNKVKTLTATMTLVQPLTVAEMDNITNTDIWESRDPAIASVTYVSKEYVTDPVTGMVTAVRYQGQVTAEGTGYREGLIIVHAPDKSYYGRDCTVTVWNYTTGISLDQSEMTLAYGESGTLTATVETVADPPVPPPYNAIWSSADPSIASVDDAGTVTANKVGTTQITATAPDRAWSAQCTVTVTAYYTGITLNKSNLELYVGQRETLRADVAPVEDPPASAVWTSETPAIATVSPSGVVIALQAGTARITASTPDGAFTETCTVNVLTHPMLVYLNKYTSNLNVGDSETLFAVVLPNQASDKNVYWDSSAPEVATVDSTGKVTAISAGTAIISVTAEDGGIGSQCNVTVTGAGSVTTIQLAQPEKPALGDGVVTWTSVTNENNGYSLQLFKDGAAYGDPVQVAHDASQGTVYDTSTGNLTAKTLSYDLSASMTNIGSYTVTVTARGTGLYTDSPASAPSDPEQVTARFAQPEKPGLADCIATWTEAAGDDAGYLVRLYKDDVVQDTFEAAQGTSSHDFTSSMGDAGGYTVTVIQKGCGLYTSSPESVHSDPQVVMVQLSQPLKPVLSRTGYAVWTPVTNENGGYSVQLHKDGTAEGAPIDIAHGVPLYTDFSASMTEPGVYTVTVTALGTGVYTDSPESEPSNSIVIAAPLAKPAKPSLANNIATWTTVDNENNGYTVKLYRDNVETGDTGEIEHGGDLSYDFTSAMSGAGTYTVTVIARGTDIYADSPESDPSDPQAVGEVVPAVISSIAPSALDEASANDGSLSDGTVTLTISNGTLAADIAAADVSVWNLPRGLDFDVTRTDDTTLTVSITGQAMNHTQADSVSNLFFVISEDKVAGATGDLTSGRTSINFNDPPAYISSVQPIVLTEADANDGSLFPSIMEITIAYGALAADIAEADVTAANLPPGLDYTITRIDDIHLIITFSGNAFNHDYEDSVSNLTFTIAQAKVSLAAGDLVTSDLSVQFTGAAPDAPTNPVEDDANNTFGWTNVPGYDSVSDYEYSVDSGSTWSVCTANPQPVGNHAYASGAVRVRVKSDPDSGRPAGAVLASDEAYTVNPAAPGAPSGPAVDDINDTLGWDWAWKTETTKYDSISDYEYSVDSGTTWSDCTANPQFVGDNSYPAGTVMVRVKADSSIGRPEGASLLSDRNFTVYTATPPAPTNPVVNDASDTFGWTNAGFNKVSDYEYSVDSGATWSDCVANPQFVGDSYYPAQAVQVRVKAKNQHPAGNILKSDDPYFASPVFDSRYPMTSNQSQTSLDLTIKTDKAGTAWYQVYDREAAAPSSAELKGSGTPVTLAPVFSDHQMNGPNGIAIGPDGNIYVSTNNDYIMKFDSSGKYLAQWGGHGSSNGQFDSPEGIAVDRSGNVYVVDTDNNRIQKFNSNGIFITKWGSYGGGNGQFSNPQGIAVDSDGNVYVTEDGARVQKFDGSGNYLGKFGGIGSGNGQFYCPRGIAIDSDGNIYVVDSHNNRVQKFDSNGVYIKQWNHGFDYPEGIAVDNSGNVWVVDTENELIQKFDSNGSYKTAWGLMGGIDVSLFCPHYVAVDSNGDVYVTDNGPSGQPLNRVEKFDGNGNYLYQWGYWGTGAGGELAPRGAATDTQGNVYIADSKRYGIMKYDKDGTYSGLIGSRGSGDGQFQQPRWVAVDGSGNIYATDSNLNRVEKFDSSGTFVTQWGTTGSGNGQFSNPQGIAVDRDGNVYVVDTGNNRIQVFDSSGNYLAQWGTAGSDGGQFSSPEGVAVDRDGNVYVVDTGNNRVQVFDADHNVIAGWGTQGSGNGQFNISHGVAVDLDLYVYVTDDENSRVQKFDGEGNFIAKWGSPGSNAEQFNNPFGIAVSNYGDIYVTGLGDVNIGTARIQKFSYQQTNRLTGLTVGHSYDIYVVAEDVRGNMQATPTRIEVTIGNPPAPTNPVVDDINNTFGWSNVAGFDNVADYEYSVDSGSTWNDCTANPQPVGNNAYAAGAVQVRVKSDPDSGRPAGAALVSNGPYTVSQPLSKPAEPVLTNNIATWTAVANENAGYTVKLWKDNVPTGQTGEMAHGNPLSYDFSAAMAEAGSYSVTVTAKGTGDYTDSPESDPSDQQVVVGTGGTDGQSQLPSGTTNLELGDNGTLDLQDGVQTASGDQIVVGGQTQDLHSYTGGDLVNNDLTVPQSVGGQDVQVQKAVRLESGVDGQPVTISNPDNSSSVTVTIPDSTSILAGDNWDGTLIPPRVVPAAGTAPAGFTIGDTVIETGSTSGVVLFDRPVILELKGVTGPVGYKPAGSDTWVQISQTAGGTYENPIAPEFPGEAFITNGTDTKIITWHFTAFASLVPEPSISAAPTTLTEAAANDGSLSSGTLVITLENGTFAADIAKADVAAANLPAGLNYTVTRTDDTHLTINITGNATNHANANDVNNLTFTVSGAKVTGAHGDLTTANISVDFTDPAYALTINIVGQGNVTKSPDQTTYIYGTSVTLTPAPSAGWSFSGWSDDLIGNSVPGAIVMDGNKTVTATFTQDEYTLVVDLTGNGTVNLDNPGPYHYGDVVQLTAAPATGWTFLAWSGDLTGSTNPTSITMDSNKTVTATFTRIEYSLTTNTSGNGAVSRSNPGPYYYGDVVQLTATPATGWTFVQWSGDGSGTANPLSVTIDANKSVTATFSQVEYSLAVNVTGSGSVDRSPDKATYHYGDTVQLTATPAAGWAFSAWSADLSGSANPTTVTMDGNKTVTATFTQDEYTLVVDLTGNGTVNLDNPGPYHYGDVVQLTAAPATGWTFLAWSGDLTGTTNPATITIDGNKTVTATFTINSFTVNAAVSGGHGSVAPATQTVNYGASAIINITPDAGYHVGGITDNGNPVTVANPLVIPSITTDHQVVVTFAIDTFTITASAGANGSISPSGTVTVNYGDSQAFAITPAAGYHVASVLVDGVSAGAVASYTFNNVTANHTIAASFAGPSVFDYAVIALAGNLSMAGNSKIISDPASPAEGDVYAGGNISLSGNAQVQGDATATGSISLTGNARITGTRAPSLNPPLSFVMLDTSVYLAQANSGHPDINALKAQAQADPSKKKAGNYTAPNGAVLGSNGTYSWITGNLVVSGNSTVTLNGVLLVNGTVTVKGNAKFKGSGAIISESTSASSAIKVEGNAQLKADGGEMQVIAAAGGIRASGNAAVVAKIYAPAGDLDFSGSGSIMTIGPMHSVGSLTISGNTKVVLGGTVWFEGSITMTGNSGLQGTGVMVAVGNIKLTGNASSKPAVAPALMISTSGSVELTGNGWLGAVVYAPNGEVKLTGNGKVYGSITGKSVTFTGNAQVNYPVSLRNP